VSANSKWNSTFSGKTASRWAFLARFCGGFLFFGPSEEDIERNAKVVTQLLVGFGLLVTIPLSFAIWQKLWVRPGALVATEKRYLFGAGLLLGCGAFIRPKQPVQP
jgi:hypothetical protein